jgi:hypothetical protein
MDWTRIELPRDVPYAEGEGRLLSSFLRSFFAAGGPEDMGLFRPRRRDPEHPEVFLMSPGTATRCPEIVELFGVEPCPAPHRSEVAMVAGHLSSRDLLLP